MAGYAPLDPIYRAAPLTPVPAAWLDQVNDNIAYLWGDSAWTAIPLASPWVTQSGATALACRHVGTRVALRGSVTSGSGTIATLPAGYAPSSLIAPGVQANGGFGWITISTSGVITLGSSSGTNVCLDCITFDTV